MQRAGSLIPAELIERAKAHLLAPLPSEPRTRVSGPHSPIGRPPVERLLMEGVRMIALGEVHDVDVALAFINTFEKYFARHEEIVIHSPPRIAAANQSPDSNGGVAGKEDEIDSLVVPFVE